MIGDVIWCDRCQRWSKTGQPYVMVEPGKFRHRMCIPRPAKVGGGK